MPHKLPVQSREELTLVREIGFNTSYYIGKSMQEEIFFLGPQMRDGREKGAHATEDAIKEFIEYWKNQIQVAEDYLANGRNNKTHEWNRV